MRVERLERRLCLSATVAFPGAEGFGQYAEGGRGGDVYYVSNLDNEGPGSFRHAVDSASGPRTIVFDVSGTIFLESDVRVDTPFVTIAGETAPGEGITLAGSRLWVVNTHDIIVRYLRSRPGDINGTTAATSRDSFGVFQSTNIIFDHVSGSWSTDEVFAFTGPGDVTIQWSIASEALRDSFHPKGIHSNGSLNYGGNLSLHHNLFVSNDVRNPKVTQYTDVVNNVVYNFGSAAIVGELGGDDPRGPTEVNLEGNYYIAGPNTTSGTLFLERLVRLFEEAELWASDNLVDFNLNGIADGTVATVENIQFHDFDSSPEGTLVDERFDYPRVTTTDPLTAFDQVLASAGASLARDAVDQRIVDEVLNQTGAFIDSQDEVGGWPDLDPGVVRLDTDRDGMSDDWENLQGLNPFDASDRNNDSDGNGYTELEEYLHALASGRIDDIVFSQVTRRAYAESTVDGVITSGDFTQTHVSDDIYEAIIEDVVAIRRRGVTTKLDHTWEFDVAAGHAITFAFEGYHDSATEDVLLEYSTDQVNWTQLFVVENNQDNDTFQTTSLPNSVAGTVYVRATDTNPNDYSPASLFVDAMYIDSTVGEIIDDGGVDVDDSGDDGTGDDGTGDDGTGDDGTGDDGTGDDGTVDDGTGDDGTGDDGTGDDGTGDDGTGDDGTGDDGTGDDGTGDDGTGDDGTGDDGTGDDGTGDDGTGDDGTGDDGTGDDGTGDDGTGDDGTGDDGTGDDGTGDDGTGDDGTGDDGTGDDGTGDDGSTGGTTYTNVTNLAVSETITSGSIVAGDYSATHASDDVYEAIEEQLIAARRSRTTTLNHTWRFDVAGGDSVTFYFEGYHNSYREDFQLEFSVDQSNWMPLLLVENNSDDGTVQTVELPNDVAGTVYIRARDTNANGFYPGTLFVDSMRIESITGDDGTGDDGTGDDGTGDDGTGDDGTGDDGTGDDGTGDDGTGDDGTGDDGTGDDGTGDDGTGDDGTGDDGTGDDGTGDDGTGDDGTGDDGTGDDGTGDDGTGDDGTGDDGTGDDGTGDDGTGDDGTGDDGTGDDGTGDDGTGDDGTGDDGTGDDGTGDDGTGDDGTGDDGTGDDGTGDDGTGDDGTGDDGTSDDGTGDDGTGDDGTGDDGTSDDGTGDDGTGDDGTGDDGTGDDGTGDDGTGDDGTGDTTIYASSENTTFGYVSGSLLETSTSDDSYEVITEQFLRRTAALEHTWNFDLSAGNHVFSVEAHLNENAKGTFVFEYFDGGTWVRMSGTEVTNSGADQTYTFNLENHEGGVVQVRVVKTNPGVRGYTPDSIYIDEISFTNF